MKFRYWGKYNGDESSLPQREHPQGAVPYKEPQSMKKFALLVNMLAVVIMVIMVWIAYIRTGRNLLSPKGLDFTRFLWAYAGMIASLLAAVPHEFLHAVCFKGEVQMFQNLKQGLLFVVGTEDMSKARFIFMGMLPNLVFGFLPYTVFLVNPNLIFLGTLGAISVSSGAGDYLNVLNTLLQVPKGALVYMSGMHSYWYKPSDNEAVR